MQSVLAKKALQNTEFWGGFGFRVLTCYKLPSKVLILLSFNCSLFIFFTCFRRIFSNLLLSTSSNYTININTHIKTKFLNSRLLSWFGATNKYTQKPLTKLKKYVIIIIGYYGWAPTGSQAEKPDCFFITETYCRNTRKWIWFPFFLVFLLRGNYSK